MKYLLALLLLFCGLSAFSQADTIFVLGAEFGATIEPTDSTFTVDIIHPTDQLGQAFTASKIQVGYRLIDVLGRLYRVKSVDATGIGSSTLTVVELQDAAGPSGTGLVYRKPDNSDCIPEIQTGDIGISYALAARVANHNAVNGCGGGGGGTVTSVVAGANIEVDATDAANPVVTNTAPDQTVSLTGAGSVGVTGTYPSFTLTGTGVTGSGSIGHVPYFDSSSSLSFGDLFWNNGNKYLGVGTSSPTGILHLKTNSTLNAIFESTTNQDAQFQFRTANAPRALLGWSGPFSGVRVFNYGTASNIFFLRGSNGFMGLHTVTPDYLLTLGGTSASARFTPHDVTLTGVEGLLYADLSEKTFKGHNGTSFFRFMQQSETVPTNGQIGVFDSTTLLYEPSNPKARSYTPTSTADTNGETGDIAYDDSYFYIKTSAGWKRSHLSTF